MMEAPLTTTSPETTCLHARCHCKTHTYAFNIPSSLLPLSGGHCYCNMCRQTNGTLFESDARLPKSVWPYTALSAPPSTLKYYSCSPNARRWFCSKCGTHLFFNCISPESWFIGTGALTRTYGLVKYDRHIYVEEGPKDDGVGVFDLLDDGLPRYAGGSDEEPPLKLEKMESLLALTKASSPAVIDPSKRLSVSCYCGRVKALLSRPIVHPDNRWLQEFATPDKMKWFGNQCGCESCRLSTGTVLSTFVFPPAEHIRWLDSAEPGSGPKELGAGGDSDWRAKAGMDWWRSSEEVVRGFCGTCGAAVLYQARDREGMEEMGGQSWSNWGVGKDAVSDVYIGLLRTSNKEGEKLADWVEFEEKVHHAEDLNGYDEELKGCLTRGSKLYVEKHEKSGPGSQHLKA